MQLRDLLVLGLQAEQHPRTLGLVLFLHRTDQRVRRCGGGGVRRFGGAIVGRSCCGGPLWWNRSCGPIGRKWCRGRQLSGRWTHVWHRTRLIARRSLVHIPLATVASAARTARRGAHPADDYLRAEVAWQFPHPAGCACARTMGARPNGTAEIRALAPRSAACTSAPRAFRTRVVPHAQH